MFCFLAPDTQLLVGASTFTNIISLFWGLHWLEGNPVYSSKCYLSPLKPFMTADLDVFKNFGSKMNLPI